MVGTWSSNFLAAKPHCELTREITSLIVHSFHSIGAQKNTKLCKNIGSLEICILRARLLTYSFVDQLARCYRGPDADLAILFDKREQYVKHDEGHYSKLSDLGIDRKIP